MNSFDQIEKKNNYRGVAISVSLHIIIILLFLWVTVWKEPYPPNPEIGIELNLGTSNTGSGNEPVASEEVMSEEEITTPVTEENSTDEEVVDASAEQMESEPTATEERPAVSNEGLPIEEKKTEEKKSEPARQDTEKTKQVAETAKEEKKPPPKTNPNALFPGKNKSQGESSTKKGDQGVKDGKVDADALMGPQGGGGKIDFNMAGWAWRSPPRPNDKSDQNGKIVFEIRVNKDGEVMKVDLKETTVSQEVVRIYRNEVSKLSFYQTSQGKTVNSYTGSITFIIESK